MRVNSEIRVRLDRVRPERPRLTSVLSSLLDDVLRRNAGEPEFHQTAREVFGSLEPVISAHPRYA